MPSLFMPPLSADQDNRELVTMLCREAGEILKTYYAGEGAEGWKLGVTRFPEVELRLIYLVAAFVKKYFPNDTVLGQDAPSDFSGAVWICDPIDGSYFFTQGIPLYTFSLSLLRDGEPVLSAVYEPMSDRLYYAEKNKGALLNGKSIFVFSPASPIGRLIVFSGGHGVNLDLGGLYNDVKKLGAKIVISYSIVQHAAMVASGQIAAVVYGGNLIQDVAAVKLLVEEAGGVVTDLNGKCHDFRTGEIRGFVIAGSQLHPQMLHEVSPHIIAD